MQRNFDREARLAGDVELHAFSVGLVPEFFGRSLAHGLVALRQIATGGAAALETKCCAIRTGDGRRFEFGVIEQALQGALAEAGFCLLEARPAACAIGHGDRVRPRARIADRNEELP